MSPLQRLSAGEEGATATSLATRLLAVPCVAGVAFLKPGTSDASALTQGGARSRPRSGTLVGDGAAVPPLLGCNSGVYSLGVAARHWGLAWRPRAGFSLARWAPPHCVRCACGGLARHGVGWVPTPSAQEACHARATHGAAFACACRIRSGASFCACFVRTWCRCALSSGWRPGSAGGAWGPHSFGECADGRAGNVGPDPQ